MNMQPSAWLFAFLKSYEQFRPTAYAATADERRRGIWTIGWGHTNGVKEGDTCTAAQGDAFLHSDVFTAVSTVNQHVTRQLTQNQFDALVSLCFNIGVGNFAGSGLLKFVNAKNDHAAAADFDNWDKQAGTVLPGLLRRREAESQHYLLAT
jgi:lysozyme